MDNGELTLKVKEIKQSFRQMMDGAVAKSMRDKEIEIGRASCRERV